jgi:hypothetical protein
MSALIRLYPAAWRERYEDEFLALLEARPPTLGDRLDIVRGAIDARLHPQVRRSPQEPVAPAPVPDQRAADLVVARRLGIAALLGGALWGLAWVVAINGPLVNDGGSTYRDGGAAMPLFLLAIALLVGGLTGQLIWLPASARLARAGAVIAIPFLILWAFGPWVMFTVLGWLIGLTVLALGAARADRWPLLASVALTATCVGLFSLGATVLAGLISLPQVISEVAMFSFGFPMWLVVGGTLVTGAAPARLRPA